MSIEFMSTYVWAVLAVILVIGAITYFDVIEPEVMLPEVCDLPSGLECNDFVVRSDEVTLVITNTLGHSIIIRDIDVDGCAGNPVETELNKGEQATFVIGSCSIGTTKYVTDVEITYALGGGADHEFVGRIEANTEIIECSDGIDNDGNGCADYPDDLGCDGIRDPKESGGGCVSSTVCEVIDSTTDTCSDAVVLHISHPDGGHAEIPTESNYIYHVCCYSSSANLGTSCSEETFLHLSSNTNAHVEQEDESNYGVDACISASPGTISCDYVLGGCTADKLCIASISGVTNAHVGACGKFPISICCEIN